MELAAEHAPNPPTKQEMLKASIGAEFACMTHLDQLSFMDKSKWSRCVVKNVKKELWELLDESGTELLKEVLDQAGGNDGVSNEW